MFYQVIFKEKQKITMTIGILVIAVVLVLTVPTRPTTWEEHQRQKEAAKQEMLEAERKLAKTTDPDQTNLLHLRIAEISLNWERDPAKSLDHLQCVGNTASGTERLCSLLWQAGSRLQLKGYSSFRWKDADWNRIKPAYERILQLAPDSDVARRALYQLGRYYLVQKDFRTWRENREEFIRRFGEQKPFYANIAAKEIGDSFLFEGNLQQTQGQYKNLLSQLQEKGEKRLNAEIYLRLLQTSWVKSPRTPPAKVHALQQGLIKSLDLGESEEYDFSAWLGQLLKENRKTARSLPLSEWAECKELWPDDFLRRFYEGLYDHAVLKARPGAFDWLSKKARTKKKVARVKADLRTIATALEAYLVDWCAGYPPLKVGGLRLLAGMPMSPVFVGDLDREVTRFIEQPLSTTRYLRIIPLDPFGKKADDFYDYYTGDDPIQMHGYIVISRGPDSSFEIDPPNDYDVRVPHPAPKLLLKAYDPTNGTFSAGDIYRVKQ